MLLDTGATRERTENSPLWTVGERLDGLADFPLRAHHSCVSRAAAAELAPASCV
jgi:hypothetical protein